MRQVFNVVSGMWSPSRTETSPNLHNRARSLSLDSASGKITCTHVYPLGVVSEGKINKIHRKAVLSIFPPFYAWPVYYNFNRNSNRSCFVTLIVSNMDKQKTKDLYVRVSINKLYPPLTWRNEQKQRPVYLCLTTFCNYTCQNIICMNNKDWNLFVRLVPTPTPTPNLPICFQRLWLMKYDGNIYNQMWLILT